MQYLRKNRLNYRRIWLYLQYGQRLKELECQNFQIFTHSFCSRIDIAELQMNLFLLAYIVIVTYNISTFIARFNLAEI